MAEKNVLEVAVEWIISLFQAGANQTNITPVNQFAAEQGIDPAELERVDWSKAYSTACASPSVPAQYHVPISHPNPTPEYIVRHVTQVTEVTNNNQQIFNFVDNSVDNSQNIDNSVNIGGDVHVEGDLSLSNNSVNATGESVAAGEDAVVASGDGSAASGDGDAAASGGVNVDASTNVGFPHGAVKEPLVTRTLDPVGVGGFGSGAPNININTGSGNQTNVEGPVIGSQVGSFGEGAQNAVGNFGSQISNQGHAINDPDNILIGIRKIGSASEASDPLVQDPPHTEIGSPLQGLGPLAKSLPAEESSGSSEEPSDPGLAL